ncbi:unnamed protein product [Pedinophyceae sp. YPF-701]|nr:unnamed protein product [Pedinophyceae sp. YPF-701]
MPLAARPDCGDAQFAGLEFGYTSNVRETLENALQAGFDFAVLPIAHASSRRTDPGRAGGGSVADVPPFTHSDMDLTSAEWSTRVVSTLSPWASPDCPNDALRKDSEFTLAQELSWALHLGVGAVITPPLRGPDAANLARLLCAVLRDTGTRTQAWVRVPATAPAQDAEDYVAEAAAATATLQEHGLLAPEPDTPRAIRAGSAGRRRTGGDPAGPPAARPVSPAAAEDGGVLGGVGRARQTDGQGAEGDTWEWWDQLATLCGRHKLLGICLDITRGVSLPRMRRWLGEPVRALSISTDAFLANNRGYPVLPRRIQEVLRTFFRHGVQVVLSGPPLITPPEDATAAARHPLAAYRDYLAYVLTSVEQPAEGELAVMHADDVLQVPLQPLKDHLESSTYEIFERDTPKYSAYERAIARALADRAKADADGAPRTQVCMVVGAGRGPLIKCALAGSAQTGVPVRVYAVEKNPNALITLQHMHHAEGWGDRVVLVCEDMRTWQFPEAADLILSELLGSFGDNELSPECLDGAMRALRPDGVAIPDSYCNYLQPVSSAQLRQGLEDLGEDGRFFETPIVVKMKRFCAVDSPQKAMTFAHPAPGGQPPDNERYVVLTFRVPDDQGARNIDGFAGYFDCHLYDDISLSIVPGAHTPGMYSWFPAFFPLRSPVRCAPGATVELHMWRRVGAAAVWYEWAVTAPHATQIHNRGGSKYEVGLF